jgi:AcrR family transcriptional regulator
MSPRTGRRAGDSGARQAILVSARRAFAEVGFGRATIRAIAADAGVDPALVHHYFGAKADLFAAAVDIPVSPSEILGRLAAVEPGRLGEGLVRAALTLWSRPDSLDAWVGLVRSATSDERAAASLREFLAAAILDPLAGRLDEDAALRTSLVASQVVGLGIARHVIALEPLASLPDEDLIAAYAPTLQRYLTGKIRPPST